MLSRTWGSLQRVSVDGQARASGARLEAAGGPARLRALRQRLSSPELDRQAGKSGVTSWQLVQIPLLRHCPFAPDSRTTLPRRIRKAPPYRPGSVSKRAPLRDRSTSISRRGRDLAASYPQSQCQDPVALLMETIQGTRIEPLVPMSRGDDPR